MRYPGAAVLVATTLAVLPVAASAQSTNRTADVIRSGAWVGAASFHRDTGRFTYCFIRTSYTDKTNVTMGLFANGGFVILLNRDDWSLTKGRKYPSAVSVDRTYLGEYPADAFSEKAFTIHFGSKSKRAIRAFRKGKILLVRTENISRKYRLVGTNRALSAAARCVRRNRKRSYEAAVAAAGGAPGGNPQTTTGTTTGGSGQNQEIPEDIKANRAEKKSMDE